MSQPVRAARAAIVAGVLAMAFVTALYVVKPVPDWAVGLFGGPSRPIDRYGGLSLTFQPAPGTEAAFATFVGARENTVRREAGRFIVEFPGLPESAATETIDLLRYGGVVMKEVVETGYAHEIGASDEVTVEVDQWRPDDGGSLHTDPYLRSHSVDALRAVVARYQPPAGTEVAYEWVEPDRYAMDARPYVRTYLVKSEVAIDATMIASATTSYDPNTNRPIVLLDFTDDGGERFCELTGRMTGGKFATIAGGRIRSAPVINGQICDGRASITMGGADHERQESEARALVAVLDTGPIPEGTIEDQAWKPAANVTGEEWKARGLFGLVGGIALGLIAFLAVRLTRPTVRPRVVTAGGMPWRRVAVTALGPLVLYLGGKYMSLPGINEVELAHVMRREVGHNESVFALGVTPIVTAYLLVELVAFAWPRLRWRRHDPRGRIGLGKAVAAVAVVLALLQAYFMAEYYEQLGRYGAEVVSLKAGLGFQLLLMVTMGAGTMVLAIIAGVIREHGLGNGYAVLMVSMFVFDVTQPYLVEGFEAVHYYMTAGTVLGVIGAVGIAVATRALLRWRIDGLRMPTSGVTPLSDSGGILFILVTLTSLGFGEQLFRTLERVQVLRTSVLANVIILFVSVPLWAWLFARPKLVPGATLGGWVRATGLTLVLLGGAGLVGIYTLRIDQLAYALLYPLNVMLVTATVLDIVDELRARRQQLVPAGILHQAQYIGRVERALEEAGIPVHFHASHIRTLFAFFGPWAPIVVLVPEAHAEVARRTVYATITTEHHAVVQAFSRDARPTPGRPLVPAWARSS